MRKKNILITGLPGIGKTTLIKKLCRDLMAYNPAGFYTDEIRPRDERIGFQLNGLNGEKANLAHILTETGHRVGRYNVDVKGFDSFLDSIDLQDSPSGLVIIDEIGKMECLSHKFVKLISKLLDSEKIIIATIAHTDGGIKGRIKKRDDVQLFKMNLNNRDTLLTEILEISKASY